MCGRFLCIIPIYALYMDSMRITSELDGISWLICSLHISINRLPASIGLGMKSILLSSIYWPRAHYINRPPTRVSHHPFIMCAIAPVCCIRRPLGRYGGAKSYFAILSFDSHPTGPRTSVAGYQAYLDRAAPRWL